jgi:UDP-N-acetylmuramoyl-L-alanyl-D-glutamate--2,6-diaminopimelate ligase
MGRQRAGSSLLLRPSREENPSAVPRPTRPPSRALADVAAFVGASVDLPDVAVHGLTHDSRAVQPGDLYAALPGTRAHGAAFAEAAVEAGAVATLTDAAGEIEAARASAPVLVVDEPRRKLGPLAAWLYDDPTAHLDVIGVTGTNGKTTTAYLVESGLRSAGRTTGLIGTVETRVAGVPLASAFTTPEAPDLQALFASMREQGVTAAAMEVSSHGLAQGRVDGTRFAVGVFTNLTQDHLDFHADMEDYFQAKALLFRAERTRAAVINIDGEWGARLATMADCPVVTTSTRDAGADWHVTEVNLRATGSTFHAVGPAAEADVTLQLAGEFNVANALGALAALCVAGVDIESAARGLAALPGVPGRLERVDADQDWLAVVDYAHTPDSVQTMLSALRPLTPGRLIVVLGCGGDRDRGKRPLMGAAAARGADVVVVTSDNPRSEDPLAIIDAIVRGTAEGAAEVLVEPDRAAAIGAACALAQHGDTVVVAGKGHEQGQVFANVVVPFDDREVLRSAIARVAGVPR